MSPEQAKGKPADKRSDIWAFGCVLYEMLTGRRAFDGEDLTDVVAAVVRGEPDWTALPSDVPAHVRTLIKAASKKIARRASATSPSSAICSTTEPSLRPRNLRLLPRSLDRAREPRLWRQPCSSRLRHSPWRSHGGARGRSTLSFSSRTPDRRHRRRRVAGRRVRRVLDPLSGRNDARVYRNRQSQPGERRLSTCAGSISCRRPSLQEPKAR